MSLAEKLGAVCCPNYMSSGEQTCYDTDSFFIHGGTEEQHRRAIAKARAACGRTPLVTTDLEFGAGQMIAGATEFPSMFAGGRAGPELAYEAGRYAAVEGHGIGYNWTLAPCVDILFNPESPITSLRSASRDPVAVAETASAYIAGLQDHGMMATAKHFPGDGLCVYDQHLTTPENTLPMSRWWQTYGAVYRAVIKAGVMAVMPGHISLPAYDERDPRNGIHPPATLSKRLLTDLLRGELGFEGLIVSDAVEMGGFSGFMNYYDACARFLEAGGDVLLFARPDERFLKEMTARVERGELSEETLDRRIVRLLACKRKVLGMASAPGKTAASGGLSSRQAAERIISAGIQMLRDRRGVLPLSGPTGKRVLHVSFGGTETHNEWIGEAMAVELGKHVATVMHLHDPGCDRIGAEVKSGAHDLVIVSMLNNQNYGTNVARLCGPVARNMMGGWMHLGVPVVFICHFHVYTHLEYRAAMDCVIRTAGTVKATIPLLIERICKGPLSVEPDELAGDLRYTED